MLIRTITFKNLILMLQGSSGVGLGCIVPSVKTISYWPGTVVLDHNKSLYIVISEELKLISKDRSWFKESIKHN